MNELFVELICEILILCFSFHQGTMSPSDSRWTMCGSDVPRQPLLVCVVLKTKLYNCTEKPPNLWVEKWLTHILIMI